MVVMSKKVISVIGSLVDKIFSRSQNSAYNCKMKLTFNGYKPVESKFLLEFMTFLYYIPDYREIIQAVKL